MAIFGPKDADLPLLTQFYQLQFNADEPIGSELDEWLYLQMWHSVPPERVALARKAEGRWRLGSSYGKSNELFELVRLHHIVRKVMDFMAGSDRPIIGVSKDEPDADAPDAAFPRHIEELNRRAEALRPMLKIIDPFRSEYDNDKPVDMVYGGADSERRIETAILAELMSALPKGRKSFRRCPTCDSVFIAGRVDQRRCSRRCNDRESYRRRSEKIKHMEGYLADKVPSVV